MPDKSLKQMLEDRKDLQAKVNPIDRPVVSKIQVNDPDEPDIYKITLNGRTQDLIDLLNQMDDDSLKRLGQAVEQVHAGRD